MALDRSIFERNRLATNRIRAIARQSDEELRTPVGEHWTVAILLAHLAFWDRRVIYVLDQLGQGGKLSIPQIDLAVNDLSLPLWAAIPPRESARIAVETADELDRRLESFPQGPLEEMYASNKRLVERALHRNEHLDEADDELKLRH